MIRFITLQLRWSLQPMNLLLEQGADDVAHGEKNPATQPILIQAMHAMAMYGRECSHELLSISLLLTFSFVSFSTASPSQGCWNVPASTTVSGGP
jgi:hypothetical protein